MNTSTLAFSYESDIENIRITQCIKSIRLNSDGFTVSIHHEETRKVHLIHQYNLSSTLSDEEKINQIVKTDKELNINCRKKIFYYHTLINTQIPEDYYTKENKDNILPLLTSKSETSTLFPERIDTYKFYNLSVWDKTLFADIKESFPGFTIKTCISNLFNLLHLFDKSEKKVILFIENRRFTILAAEKNSFLGTNSFSFTNETDFIYYIIYFIRKIFIRTENIHISIGGNIEEQSVLFQSVKKYFKQTSIFHHTHLSEIDNGHYFCDLF